MGGANSAVILLRTYCEFSNLAPAARTSLQQYSSSSPPQPPHPPIGCLPCSGACGMSASMGSTVRVGKV